MDSSETQEEHPVESDVVNSALLNVSNAVTNASSPTSSQTSGRVSSCVSSPYAESDAYVISPNTLSPASSSKTAAEGSAPTPSAMDCSICNSPMKDPRTLHCFHSFCYNCLKDLVQVGSAVKNGATSNGNNGNAVTCSIDCPKCHFKTKLTSDGLDSLLRDYSLSYRVEMEALDAGQAATQCGLCTDGDGGAVAKCFACSCFICAACVKAHTSMSCFQKHKYDLLSEIRKPENRERQPLFCWQHRDFEYEQFCEHCSVPICARCMETDQHREHKDQCVLIEQCSPQESVEHLKALVTRSRTTTTRDQVQKTEQIEQLHKMLEHRHKDLEQYRETLIDLINKQMTRVFADLEQSVNDECTAIRNDLCDIEAHAMVLEQAQRFLEDLHQNCSRVEMLDSQRGLVEILTRLLRGAGFDSASGSGTRSLSQLFSMDMKTEMELLRSAISRAFTPHSTLLALNNIIDPEHSMSDLGSGRLPKSLLESLNSSLERDKVVAAAAVAAGGNGASMMGNSVVTEIANGQRDKDCSQPGSAQKLSAENAVMFSPGAVMAAGFDETSGLAPELAVLLEKQSQQSPGMIPLSGGIGSGLSGAMGGGVGSAMGSGMGTGIGAGMGSGMGAGMGAGMGSGLTGGGETVLSDAVAHGAAIASLFGQTSTGSNGKGAPSPTTESVIQGISSLLNDNPIVASIVNSTSSNATARTSLAGMLQQTNSPSASRVLMGGRVATSGDDESPSAGLMAAVQRTPIGSGLQRDDFASPSPSSAGPSAYQPWSTEMDTAGVLSSPYAPSTQRTLQNILQQTGLSGGGGDILGDQFNVSPSAGVVVGSGAIGSPLGGAAGSSVSPFGGASANVRPQNMMVRRKMKYNLKFGEFGVQQGQFTEPSGVCTAPGGDIIVADTNSHRIQMFDRVGHFKFSFGECGKQDGQLLYPNRVAVFKKTGEIIVTERAPTHQVQVFSPEGVFIRKFGANVLQFPRGVCVDDNGLIIVVECKVMRVVIFEMGGQVLNKFSCVNQLDFPNSVACSTARQEIFISDNRAHCVKVFNYQGQFVRQIGGEGITNYPIGVAVSVMNHIVVADNHNNFNVTVFDLDGNCLALLESQTKHAQCFDVALTEHGSIIVSTKDYRLYMYCYLEGLLR